MLEGDKWCFCYWELEKHLSGMTLDSSSDQGSDIAYQDANNK